jgi:hypothetical protein
MFAGEEGAFCVDGALVAFWVGALADHVAVMFEEKIGSGAGVKGSGDLGFDCVLGFAVGHSVVFALSSQEDADEHVGAVGGDGCDGCDMGEEKDSVCAGAGDVGKFSEFSSCLIERPGEGGGEIAAELVLYAHGDLFEAEGA